MAVWSSGSNPDELEAVNGLLEYAAYIAGGLEGDLQRYAFWLEEHRRPASEESLPNL